MDIITKSTVHIHHLPVGFVQNKSQSTAEEHSPIQIYVGDIQYFYGPYVTLTNTHESSDVE